MGKIIALSSTSLSSQNCISLSFPGTTTINWKKLCPKINTEAFSPSVNRINVCPKSACSHPTEKDKVTTCSFDMWIRFSFHGEFNLRDHKQCKLAAGMCKNPDGKELPCCSGCGREMYVDVGYSYTGSGASIRLAGLRPFDGHDLLNKKVYGLSYADFQKSREEAEFNEARKLFLKHGSEKKNNTLNNALNKTDNSKTVDVITRPSNYNVSPLIWQGVGANLQLGKVSFSIGSAASAQTRVTSDKDFYQRSFQYVSVGVTWENTLFGFEHEGGKSGCSTEFGPSEFGFLAPPYGVTCSLSWPTR